MSCGGRRGQSNAPPRGPHHQTDLDNAPHDSSPSPAWQARLPVPMNAGSSHTNGRKDKRGRTAKPSLSDLSSLSDSGAYVQWKESPKLLLSGWME